MRQLKLEQPNSRRKMVLHVSKPEPKSTVFYIFDPVEDEQFSAYFYSSARQLQAIKRWIEERLEELGASKKYKQR